MKYHVFAWYDFEANGGIGDYVDAFPDLEAAKHYFDDGRPPTAFPVADRCDIVVIEGDDFRVVLTGERLDNGRIVWKAIKVPPKDKAVQA